MKLEDRLSPWYVTGFVDGEGSFTYNYGRGRTQLAVVFAIRLTLADRPILAAIRDFFGGIGRLYAAPPRKPGRFTGPCRATCYFKTTSPFELLRVVDHFDRYSLQGEKRVPYAIWREMVFLRAAHHGERPPDELRQLAEKLSRAIPRNRPRVSDRFDRP